MSNQSKKKIGIAFGGGGPRGIAHVGVLRAFEEAGLRPDSLAGTSVGALVGALYAFGVPLKDIGDFAFQMTWMKVAKPVLSRYGLVSNRGIYQILQQFIGSKDISEADIPISIVASDISSGVKVVLNKGDVREAVMASTCIPGVFTPVEIGGRMLVDGGLVDNIPVSALSDYELDLTVGVDLYAGELSRRPKGIVEVITNSMSIMQKRLQGAGGSPDVLVRPQLPLTYLTDRETIKQMYDEGYRAGQEAAAKIV